MVGRVRFAPDQLDRIGKDGKIYHGSKQMLDRKLQNELYDRQDGKCLLCKNGITHIVRARNLQGNVRLMGFCESCFTKNHDKNTMHIDAKK